MGDMRQPAPEDLAARLMGLFLPIHYRIGVGFEETLQCGQLSRKQVAILWLMRSEGGPEGSMRRKDIERLLSSGFETRSSTITRSLAAKDLQEARALLGELGLWSVLCLAQPDSGHLIDCTKRRVQRRGARGRCHPIEP